MTFVKTEEKERIARIYSGLRADRQKARTDLFFLAYEILRYRDVEESPHRQLCDTMQKFRGGEDLVDPKTGMWKYTPACQIWELQGPRFTLTCWPRGHLKTTLLTIAHTIQWIVNFSDVRILISTAIGEQASRILTEIKGHFQFNPFFRAVFPEYCPAAAKVAEFGNQEAFIVPNRERKWMKEPTVSVSSVGKVIAGYHYEVLKFSDMVDKENVKTPNMIRDVIEHINYCDPLLERSPIPPHHGWKDIEGTRYGIADAYGDIIRKEEKRKNKEWSVAIESADPRDRVDSRPLWPSRFPEIELRRIENEDELQYTSQYRQKPIPESSALADAKEIIWFPRRAVEGLPLRLHATIDLHGMEANTGNDYTVINVAGFDRDGRMYVLDIRRGRFNPFEVIANIFDVWKMYRLVDIKMEKDAHARVLLPFFNRECSKRQIFPVVVPIKRDNRTSKQQRIRGLQAWFKTGIIRFCDDLPSKADILEEILNFPDASIHDDILDTLTDHMMNREGGMESDIWPNAPERTYPTMPPWLRPNQFRGFGENGEPVWLGQETENQWYDRKTGM